MTLLNNINEDHILVSAVISVYKAEKFIKGCLEDLLAQTLYQKGELEIIAVNSGSPENEEEIILAYAEKYPRIKYIKTEERESLYKAWNRGIKAASGKYITNANSDDRHAPDALEKMALVMEENPYTDLVYADQYISNDPDVVFAPGCSQDVMRWSDFDRDLLLFGCFIGPQPLWKKELHERFGYFDESLKVVGDYEFWLRVSRGAGFKHIKEILGVYFYNPESLERSDESRKTSENEYVQQKYLKKFIPDLDELNRIEKKLFYVSSLRNDFEYLYNTVKIMERRKAELLMEKEIKPIENGSEGMDNDKDLIVMSEEYLAENNYAEAENCLLKALDAEPVNVDVLNNLSVVKIMEDKFEEAAGYLKKVFEIDNTNPSAIENLTLMEKIVDEKINSVKVEQAEQMISTNQFGEAREILEGLSTEDENNPVLLNDLAVIDIMESKLEDGVHKIEKILSIDPENETAKYNLQILENVLTEQLNNNNKV